MRLSSAEYEAILARQRQRAETDGHSPPSGQVQREKSLHEAILRECQRRRFYVVHSRMDQPSTNGVGTPDFIVALPGGATLWIECKRPGQKLRPEQAAVGHYLTWLGHPFRVVHTITEFLDCLPHEEQTPPHAAD